MKKLFLIVFILVDLAAIAGASIFLYDHLTTKRIQIPNIPGLSVRKTPVPQTPVTPTIGVVPSSPTLVTSPLTTPPVSTAPTAGYRNIAFTYKNGKAKQVQIRADFTSWKGVPMRREPSGVWSYTKQLATGEYAYCFSVDGKIIKDPANKRTKLIAQTAVSSILVEKVGATKTVEP